MTRVLILMVSWELCAACLNPRRGDVQYIFWVWEGTTGGEMAIVLERFVAFETAVLLAQDITFVLTKGRHSTRPSGRRRVLTTGRVRKHAVQIQVGVIAILSAFGLEETDLSPNDVVNLFDTTEPLVELHVSVIGRIVDDNLSILRHAIKSPFNFFLEMGV